MEKVVVLTTVYLP